MKKLIYLLMLLPLLASCEKEDGVIFGTATAGDLKNNITVTLYDMNCNEKASTTTANDGTFRFSGLEDGNYYLAATLKDGDDVYNTGFKNLIVYVETEIEKEVTLTLNKVAPKE